MQRTKQRCSSAPSRTSNPVILARILFIGWLIGVVRVIGALLRGEQLGGEVTIALLMTVLLPWVILDVYAAQGRRGTKGARKSHED